MRLDWIDKGKGIGILLVILGHTFCPPSFKFWLYSFHMPLFFFLSGYVFKCKDLKFSCFLKKKVNSLLIPAFIMQIIIILYYLIESIIFNTNYSMNFLQRMLGIFIQRRGGEFSFGPWFLICLFTTQIMMYFFLKYIKGDFKLLIIGVICSLIGYSYCTLIGFVLPWAFEVSLIAILFFISGYLMKKNEDKYEKLFEFRYLFIYFLIHSGLIYIQLKGEPIQLDMYANKYCNYLLFILNSFSGIFLINTMVKNLSLPKELIYIGKNSLVYYSLHESILSTSLLLMKQVYSTSFIESYSYYFGMINLLLCVIILHGIASILNKYQILSVKKFQLLINRSLVKGGR